MDKRLPQLKGGEVIAPFYSELKGVGRWQEGLERMRCLYSYNRLL